MPQRLLGGDGFALDTGIDLNHDFDFTSGIPGSHSRRHTSLSQVPVAVPDAKYITRATDSVPVD